MRTMTSSFINNSNMENDIYLNKKNNNSSIGERVNNFIFNINDNTTNKSSLDIRGKNNKHSKIKIHLNIPNDNYNKNNTMINYHSNIDKESINLEKLTIQKKLAEYHKLIDIKLNNIKSNKRISINKKNKRINNSSIIKLKIFKKEVKSTSGNFITTIPLKNNNIRSIKNKEKNKSKSNRSYKNSNKNIFNMF